MTVRGKISFALLVLLVAACKPRQLIAQTSIRWVGTWAAGTSGQTVPAGSQTMAATTYRNSIHTSMGGSQLRVKLTNEFGAVQLIVGQAAVGMKSGTGGAIAGSSTPLTFGGLASVTIPPGAIVISDPVNMSISAFSDLSIDIYLPQQSVPVLSYHQTSSSSTYSAPGNQVGATTLSGSTLFTSWYFLKAVDVQAYTGSAIVTLGDSITDGYHSTQNTNHRWPDVMAAKLAASGLTINTAVINAGITGNHLISGTNASAVTRLARDVLTQNSVKYIIVFEGINDILSPSPTTQSANDIIAGLAQIEARGDELGATMYVGTITPDSSMSAAQEQERQTVNQWIRTSGVYNAVIDFDAIVRDPANPAALLKAYDSGDHLHPNDAGYQAMGNSIDPTLFP